ncbi:Aldo/keto reductase [Aspergillus heteromorphus CBS 117.55]|uniref:Aldo/keto reductase n=1 Tax=Aspergillus heteromorphus CBS 117.55 TaxID=1448321 RepID=A0A317WV48_9EURO|nr:Aldo/keto reductase [Aspergillus heteromorphus CBS 117.55]PWY89182.1 Aldo/keto reductase [Aspergillus heteromorphus CBS 117.55]
MPRLNNLPTRPLGKNGPLIPRIGLGLMAASGTYGAPLSETEHLTFLDEVYNRGETFWDTADKYTDSEAILGKWFAMNPSKREDIFLATKFGICTAPEGTQTGKKYWMDSTPEYCRAALERSLTRLGLPYVDLYYIHRLDKVTPIEKTIEAMVQLKKEGKIRFLGLSECSAESLRRAHAIHPITCVQVEYSIFCREIESPRVGLLEVARELGVAVVAYSPLGNGVLGGGIRSREDVAGPGDSRGVLPWLREGNIEVNVAVVDRIAAMARKKGVTTAQLALAWLLAQGDDVFPIPGTRRVERLEENLGSLGVELLGGEEGEMRRLAERVVGGRFQALTGFDFADTPVL